MKSPKTYNGYSNKNKLIATYTGKDASTLIDPEAVDDAIENVRKVMEDQLTKITEKLRKEASDSETALIVKGTHMGDPINDTATTIDKLPNAVYNSLQELYQLAETAHDRLQDDANEDAKDSVRKAKDFDHFG